MKDGNNSTNYYDLVGVARHADQKQIEEAFLHLAEKCRPDLHPNDAAAARQFALLEEAYETLGDPKKRLAYDDLLLAQEMPPPQLVQRPSKKVVEKNLPLAIGLNVVLPGLGYIYMGRIIIGPIACLLYLAMFFKAPFILVVLPWLIMNLIMGIDMLILNNKNQKALVQQNMKKCPNCAEMIQKEAKACRFCGSKFSPSIQG